MSIKEELASAMSMPVWPSKQPYMFRSSVGGHCYYSDVATSHNDDLICSFEQFEQQKGK